MTDVAVPGLPRELTAFVGRTAELAEVERLLGRTAFLTLTGAGGSGKTRLAIRAARAAAPSFADGAVFVDLAPLSDEALVPGAVVAALGVRDESARPPRDVLLGYLRDKSLLLVLDNCEHLVGTCAELVDAILRACRGVRVLATSREVLGVDGEAVYRVPSLATPDPARLLPAAELSSFDAVRLFVERAAAADPGFALDDANAAAVAQVCRRLDGIPLALELAAARLRVLSIEQIAARLDDRFLLLTGGVRTALRRQQTLRATVDWSHDLLEEPERVLLRRLAVFAGGWMIDAAEAVCADGEGASGRVGEGLRPEDVLDLLGRLVDKSLVSVERGDSAARYRLLETIRQYALEKLAAPASGYPGEAAALRDRHLAWCVAFAESVSRELLEPEQDNVRAALTWAEATKAAEAGLRLAASMAGFWSPYGIGRSAEGGVWLERMLALPDAGAAPRFRARAMLGRAFATWAVGDYRRARPLADEAHAALAEADDPVWLGEALHLVGTIALYRGDYDRALPILEEAADAEDRLGRPDVLVILRRRSILAMAYQYAGDDARARALAGELVARGINGTFNQGLLERYLLEEGRYDEFEHHWRDRLRAGADGNTRTGYAHGSIALVSRAKGDLRAAAEHAREGLALAHEVGSRWNVARALDICAGVAVAEGHPERGARFFGAAEALREWMDSAIPVCDRPARERDVAAARAALGEAAFAAAWAQGRAMGTDGAVAEVLAAEPAHAPAAPAPRGETGPLSAREREVAALVGRGYTNRRIAEALVIAERTAANHVEHILDKLGFRSRAQVAAWATQHGLVAAD